MGIDPYIGHTFHESPLFLHFYHLLITNFNNLIPHIFIAIDVMTAVLLCFLTYNQLIHLRLIEEQRIAKLSKSDEIKKLSIDNNSISDLSLKVAAIYLLSPYSLLSCVGQSTSVFTNFLMALILYTSTKEYRILSIALLAVLSYQSFYPLMMIIPILMIIEQHKALNSNKQVIGVQYSSSAVRFSMLSMLLLFLVFVFALLFLSYNLMGNSFDFISATYGFLWVIVICFTLIYSMFNKTLILQLDCTRSHTNYWYILVFFHRNVRPLQRLLFVDIPNKCLYICYSINSYFEVNLSISKVWLQLKPILLDRKNAYFLSYVLLILLSLFKPYPTVSDFALYTALLPQWTHLFSRKKTNNNLNFG